MSIPQPESNPLIQLIRQHIEAANGYISFAQFMQLALYTPDLGYYSTSTVKLGPQGDFVTAPEISPLFARCLAKQCQQVLHAIPEGDILELGAGTGILAKDLLLELEQQHCLPKHYYIYEISSNLRQRQQELLRNHCPHLFPRIQWLDSLNEVTINGCIIANEVLDALPIHCFQVEKHKIYERCIAWENNQLIWKLTQPTTELMSAVLTPFLEDNSLEDGYVSEINLEIPTFIKDLSNTLKQGVILLFDYGYGRQEYYHPDRTQGTLMCYYQHQKHGNPLVHVGQQDITAHVDFTSVVESAVNAGLKFKGYTTQSSFLLATGLLELAQSSSLLNKDLFLQNQAIKKLTMPSEMGEAIKVIGFSKEYHLPLVGFSLHDRSRDL